MDKEKNTILGLLLIGLCCIISGWIIEMLVVANLGLSITDQDAEAVLESVRRTHNYTAIIYVLGVIFVSAGGVRMIRLPVAEIGIGE